MKNKNCKKNSLQVKCPLDQTLAKFSVTAPPQSKHGSLLYSLIIKTQRDVPIVPFLWPQHLANSICCRGYNQGLWRLCASSFLKEAQAG